MERASLIYEFNPDSPLFARVAFDELEKNHPEKVIKIIEPKLEKFSDYPTPYFILGLAKAYLKEFDEAENYILKGASLLNSEESHNYYLAEIEKIKESLAAFSKGRKVSFSMPEVSEVKTEEIEVEEKPEKKPSKHRIVLLSEEEEDHISGREKEEKVETQDELDDLIKELRNAKMPPIEINLESDEAKVEKLKEDLFENPSIASETLGGIYLAQKNYQEALVVYEKLLETKPDKAGVYKKKISEIKESLKLK